MAALDEFQVAVLRGVQEGLTDDEIKERHGGTGIGKVVRTLCIIMKVNGRAELMFRSLLADADPEGRDAAAAYLLVAGMPRRCRYLLAEIVRMCITQPPEDLGDVRAQLQQRVRDLKERFGEENVLYEVLASILVGPSGMTDVLGEAAQRAGLKGGGERNWIKLARIAYLATLFEGATPDAGPHEPAPAEGT